MNIVIEKISNSKDIAAMLEVWQEVFERELGIVLPQNSTASHVSHWLARLEANSEAVGTLSVVDTTGQHELHNSLGLKFDPATRVARFTHLAVLKPYRRMNIPLRMMLEAHRSVIVPGQFQYTWLLFDVEKAANSFLSRQLGFTPLRHTFVDEYGCRCPLVRNERTREAARAIAHAESYLKHYNVHALSAGAHVPLALGT